MIDATGARAAVDLFRASGLHPICCTITGGEREKHHEGREYSVPKAQLISGFDMMYRTGALEVVHDLPDREQAEEELQNFRRRIGATGRATYAAAEGAHDDTIMSISMACWWAKKRRGVTREVPLRI